MNEIEQVYQNFWRPIIENKDGSLNLEQVKKELYDFKIVMKEVTKVYDHITGGRFSKINTDAQYIIDAAEDYYEGVFACNCPKE